MTEQVTRKRPGPHRRVPAQDSLWLHLDRPENRMIVTSVLWTRTPVDPDRLRRLVSDRLLARYPVYFQRAVRRGAAISWETDPGFDLSDHLVVRSCHRPPRRKRCRSSWRLAAASRSTRSIHCGQ